MGEGAAIGSDRGPTREDRRQEKLARRQADQLAAAEGQRERIELQRQAAIEAIRRPAIEALTAGRWFYRVELSHGGTDRAFLGHMETKSIQGDEVEEILAIIESVGWRLEHAGFVFVPTGKRPATSCWPADRS